MALNRDLLCCCKRRKRTSSHSALESRFSAQHRVPAVEMSSVSLSRLGLGEAFPAGFLSRYKHAVPPRGLRVTKRDICLCYCSHRQLRLSRNGVGPCGKLL